MIGEMSGLKVGRWLVDAAEAIPNPSEDDAGLVGSGYGLVFYVFQALFFRFCLMAGATPENFGYEDLW